MPEKISVKNQLTTAINNRRMTSTNKLFIDAITGLIQRTPEDVFMDKRFAKYIRKVPKLKTEKHLVDILIQLTTLIHTFDSPQEKQNGQPTTYSKS